MIHPGAELHSAGGVMATTALPATSIPTSEVLNPHSTSSVYTVLNFKKKEKRNRFFASDDFCLGLVIVAADPSICVARAARVRHYVVVITKAWIRIY